MTAASACSSHQTEGRLREALASDSPLSCPNPASILILVTCLSLLRLSTPPTPPLPVAASFKPHKPFTDSPLADKKENRALRFQHFPSFLALPRRSSASSPGGESLLSTSKAPLNPVLSRSSFLLLFCAQEQRPCGPTTILRCFRPSRRYNRA